MRGKNSVKFTYLNFSRFLEMAYRSRLLLAIITALILLAACKKTVAPIQQNLAEQYFEQNILNKDFIVKLATDTGVDLTGNYTGYKFRLTKNTMYDGPMTGIRNGVTISGTWTSNADYGKLIISLTSPAAPAEFSFINRSWRFTRKALPIMELAPWGSTDPKILHMERQ